MSFILLGILNSQVTASSAGAFDLLETTLISTDTASVTFSNLNNYSGYKHLQIRAAIRSTRASNDNDSFLLRLNSDTGSNYARHALYGNGSSVASFATTSATSMFIGESPASTSTASAFGATIIDLLDFSSTQKNKTIRSLSGKPSASNFIYMTSGLWINTAAVTSMTLLFLSGSIAANSRFSLYGVK